MKRKYDFLVSEREPFQYVEKAKIVMKDGMLTALRGADGTQVISPSALLILMLGAGTSISQDAAIFCAENDLFLCFARGGSNIHSMWHSGRYSNPEALRNQIKKITKNRLEYAKALLIYRIFMLGKLTPTIKTKIDRLNSISEILGYEGAWYKNVYKNYAIHNNISFKRDYSAEAKDIINKRLNILNNALYSICTAICYCTNLNPSIAILHGQTRRGGLAFDLADLIKIAVVFDLAFNKKDIKTVDLMHNFAKKLKQNNQYFLKILLKICLELGEDEDNFIDLLKVDL